MKGNFGNLKHYGSVQRRDGGAGRNSQRKIVKSKKKKCAGYDSRFNSVIQSEKAPTKPDPHRTQAKTASQMFGRIRASTSSLETLEGSPSKILKDDTLSIYEATLMKLKIGARVDTSEVIDDSSVSSPCAKEANQPDFNPESTSSSETTMMDTQSDNSSPRVSDIVSSGNSEQRRQVNLSILNFFKVVDTGHARASSSAKATTSTENGSSESISSTSVEYDY